MQKVIKTTKLASGKSTISIDLVKHSKGATYVQINQKIYDELKDQHIKVNPIVLDEFIQVLQSYKAAIPKKKEIIDDFQGDKIQQLYFKNIPIKNIAIQMGLTSKKVEQILRGRDISIVSNKPPKSGRWNDEKRWWRRKKR